MTQPPSLCQPTGNLTCFACCPPIRGPAHDTLAARDALTRRLAAQTDAIANRLNDPRPATGVTCWGLGFLDCERTRVGCLLHPAANSGRDLRDLTGWGDKCRREACREARVYAGLSSEPRAWLTRLAHGLDAFAYSSRSANPMFHLLMWGPIIIEALAETTSPNTTRQALADDWAPLWNPLNPERDGYPIQILLERAPLSAILDPGFIDAYGTALENLATRHRDPVPPQDRRPFVHQLGLPAPAARFLRTTLGWQRAHPRRAMAALDDLRTTIARLDCAHRIGN